MRISSLRSPLHLSRRCKQVFQIPMTTTDGTPLACSGGGKGCGGARKHPLLREIPLSGFAGRGGLWGYDFFSVYDGHDEARVAHLCQERMHVWLAKEVSVEGWPCVEGRWREIIVESCSRLDGEVEATAHGESERTMGSTAMVAMMGTKLIVAANCCDSRIVLSRDGAALPLPFDHKGAKPDEGGTSRP